MLINSENIKETRKSIKSLKRLVNLIHLLLGCALNTYNYISLGQVTSFRMITRGDPRYYAIPFLKIHMGFHLSIARFKFIGPCEKLEEIINMSLIF